MLTELRNGALAWNELVLSEELSQTIKYYQRINSKYNAYTDRTIPVQTKCQHQTKYSNTKKMLILFQAKW